MDPVLIFIFLFEVYCLSKYQERGWYWIGEKEGTLMREGPEEFIVACYYQGPSLTLTAR